MLPQVWVNANCPHPKLRADFMCRLDEARAARLNCWFAVGGVLTRWGTPFLVDCFALRVVRLPARRPAGGGAGVAARRHGLRRRADAPVARPAAGARPSSWRGSRWDLPSLSAGQPFAGSFAYRAAGDDDPPEGTACGWTTRWGGAAASRRGTTPGGRWPAPAEVRFTCPPLALAGPQSTLRYQGPALRCSSDCAPLSPRRTWCCGSLLSNACATLIEIV